MVPEPQPECWLHLYRKPGNPGEKPDFFDTWTWPELDFCYSTTSLLLWKIKVTNKGSKNNKKDKKPDKAEDEKNNEENQWMDIQLNS